MANVANASQACQAASRTLGLYLGYYLGQYANGDKVVGVRYGYIRLIDQNTTQIGCECATKPRRQAGKQAGRQCQGQDQGLSSIDKVTRPGPAGNMNMESFDRFVIFERCVLCLCVWYWLFYDLGIPDEMEYPGRSWEILGPSIQETLCCCCFSSSSSSLFRDLGRSRLVRCYSRDDGDLI